MRSKGLPFIPDPNSPGAPHSPLRIRRWRKALSTLSKGDLPSSEPGQGKWQWDQGGDSYIPGSAKFHTGKRVCLHTERLFRDEACSSVPDRKAGGAVQGQRKHLGGQGRPQPLASRVSPPGPQPHCENGAIRHPGSHREENPL